jgi:hypothetical protein
MARNVKTSHDEKASAAGVDSSHTQPETPQAASAPPSEAARAEVPPDRVLMVKDGHETLVRNNASVQIMEGLGWKRVD